MGGDESRQRQALDGVLAAQRGHRHAGRRREERVDRNQVAVVEGTEGELTITGHRLDGKASPLRADIPSGYGATGFLPSGIYFPTEGCWEVTGAVGTAKLTFVTLGLKASTYGLRAD
jgi:hypothetical protein